MAANGALNKINKAAKKSARVCVISEHVRLPLSREAISRLAMKVLAVLKEKDARICIFFVNDEKIRKLNLKYRGINKPTDCLAFPMREGAGGDIHREVLGDIVISMDTAAKNSKYFDSTVRSEISLYIIHGVLHLLGFKDTTASARKTMRGIEERVLKLL